MKKMPFLGKNRVTSCFGMRGGVAHKGIDIVGDEDKTVRAVVAGKIGASTIVTKKSDITWQWGNYVRVDLDDGTRHYYCHLQSRAVNVGQRIEAGDVLGVMGNTGYSFGAHLHFEVRTTGGISRDPSKVLGIENKLGTHVYSPASDDQSNKEGDDEMKMGIYSKCEKTVSSQLLKEGALSMMQNGALVLYERRMVREVDEDTLSTQFETMRNEMLENEILAIKEK